MQLNARKQAYDGICRLLTPLAEEPPFDLQPGDPAWLDLFQVADANFVLPGLRDAILLKRLRSRAPEAMLEALEEAHRLTLERCRAIREQMLELARALADAGVTPLWLKGAALLAEQDWERHIRTMTDIDFWVPDANRQPAALEALNGLGYTVQPAAAALDWSKSHHYAPLAHPARPVRVEVHRHIVRPPFAPLFPDPAPERLETANWNGCPVARLDLSARILHSLIQCSLMSVPPLESGRIRLYKVLDLVRLLERRGCWEFPSEVLAAIARHPWRKPLSGFLTLLERDFLIANPLDRDRACCDAVDHHLRHGRPPLRWLLAHILPAPVNWLRLLAAPGQWRDRGARRVQFLLASLRP